MCVCGWVHGSGGWRGLTSACLSSKHHVSLLIHHLLTHQEAVAALQAKAEAEAAAREKLQQAREMQATVDELKAKFEQLDR